MKKPKRTARGNGSSNTVSKKTAAQMKSTAAPIRLEGSSGGAPQELKLDEESLESLRQIDQGMAQSRIMLANAVMQMLDMAGRVQQVDTTYRTQVTEIAKAKGLDMNLNWSFSLATGSYTKMDAPAQAPVVPSQTQQ